MPDHTRSHTRLRNAVIASQFFARRPRITRNAMTAAMIRPMGFAIMARFHSHWAAVTTPVAMAPAIIAIRWAIVAAILRARMIEAHAREAIHAPIATTPLHRAGRGPVTTPNPRPGPRPGRPRAGQ